MTPRAVDMRSVRRILIIKLSALGDIVHALPVAAALKESFPHLEISWLTEEAYFPLLAGNPSLDNILTLPRGRGRQLRSWPFLRDYFGRLRDMRRRRFDLSVDLQGLSKSALLAAVSGAPERLAYHWLREAAPLFERPVSKRPESVHIVDQYLDVARYLGANVDNVRFPFDIPEADDASVAAMLAENGMDSSTPFVSINPASGAAIKQWSAANFARVLDELYREHGLRGVVVTANKAAASEVVEMVNSPCVNLAGRTSLKQLAAVLRRSAVHVCGDTGSGHLAAALCTPVVALIGPTDADRSYPYGQRNNVIRHNEECGAKCDWHHCQFATPHCMEAITVQEVISQIERLLPTRV